MRDALIFLLAFGVVTANPYGAFATGLVSATAARRIDWVGDTIQASAHTVTYVPNIDSHDFYDDVTNEVAATGYAAGGVTLTGKTVFYDNATNETRLDADDLAWTITGALAGVRRIVYRKNTGSAATSPLISVTDFGADEGVTDGVFTVQHHANGVLKMTAL